MAEAKANAVSKINGLTFLQDDRKADFVKKANSAKDMKDLKTVSDEAADKNKIESQKGIGTVTFSVRRITDGKPVKTLKQRIKEGTYDVTYEYLGLTKDNVKYVRGANFVGSGGLTVTIKAQKDTEVIIWINVK